MNGIMDVPFEVIEGEDYVDIDNDKYESYCLLYKMSKEFNEYVDYFINTDDIQYILDDLTKDIFNYFNEDYDKRTLHNFLFFLNNIITNKKGQYLKLVMYNKKFVNELYDDGEIVECCFEVKFRKGFIDVIISNMIISQESNSYEYDYDLLEV